MHRCAQDGLGPLSPITFVFIFFFWNQCLTLSLRKEAVTGMNWGRNKRAGRSCCHTLPCQTHDLTGPTWENLYKWLNKKHKLHLLLSPLAKEKWQDLKKKTTRWIRSSCFKLQFLSIVRELGKCCSCHVAVSDLLYLWHLRGRVAPGPQHHHSQGCRDAERGEEDVRRLVCVR